jgi:hypothetical protein
MITEDSGMTPRDIDNHIEINFNIDTPKFVRLNHKDYPHSVLIVSAGWNDMYHVIREHGDADDFKHVFVNEAAVEAMYGFEVVKKLKEIK